MHIQKLVVVQATWLRVGAAEMECNQLIWDVLGVEMIKLTDRLDAGNERQKLRMAIAPIRIQKEVTMELTKNNLGKTHS